MKHKIVCGHVLDVLKVMPDESIDTIVTSPPYWGLRDYGEETNTIWGGDSNCEHEWIVGTTNHDNLRPSKVSEKTIVASNKELRFRTHERVKNALCAKCGAWYGQLGLEPILDLYIEHLMDIMRELKRVLKKTGVIFWNHADSYGGSRGASGKYPEVHPEGNVGERFGIDKRKISIFPSKPPALYLTPKCMLLQNYRFIIRCIDELGLILRDVIIWAKKIWVAKENKTIGNAMPSSVRDRCVFTYEPVFMLVKNKKYFFDQDALRVPYTQSLNRWGGNELKARGKSEWDSRTGQKTYRDRNMRPNAMGANRPNIWQIHTERVEFTHFACFPSELVKWCILAGCPQWICKRCGNARVRITRTKKTKEINNISELRKRHKDHLAQPLKRYETIHYTIGWRDCACNAGWESGVVLDPFGGSGTVGIVAEKLGRNSILIDLNKEYCEMAYKRLKSITAQAKLGEEPSIIERVGF